MIASRIALPVRDLGRSAEFYRDALKLVLTGGFRDHAGYDGDFYALPGGGELELTTGPAPPAGIVDEDLLLVLYVAGRDELEQWTARLAGLGLRPVPAANPYWNRTGITVLDPDGYRVVLAVRARTEPAPVRIEPHEGDRSELRPLFELAESSAEQLAAYLELGTVLVARRGDVAIGHLQLIPTQQPGEIEIKNLAVREQDQGRGVGRALVAAAVAHAERAGYARITVKTAAADTGDVRFYQRVGFRLTAVEHDAFTPETGYPDPILIDGIELRDAVWFARMLPSVESP